VQGEWRLGKQRHAKVGVQWPLNHLAQLLVALHLLTLHTQEETGVEEDLSGAESQRQDREQTQVGQWQDELRED